MASKKKRPPSRPQPGSRPAAKRPAQPAAGVAKGAGPRPDAPAKAAPAKAAPKPARERTGPTRAERLAAAEAARRRKATRNRALIAGGLVAVIVLLVVTISNSRRSNDAVVSKLEASGACTYDTKADPDSGPGNNHVTGDITYKVNPPSGGNHNPSPAPPGIFTVDTAPPDSQIVHSLEHGYVAIWYRPDIEPAQLTDLQALANRYIKDVLLVPRASLTDKPVAATAWHRRLLCTRPDVDALERFITSYRNKGPEKVAH
jgi:hypothetical protein